MNYIELRETIFEKNVFDLYFDFLSLAHVPSTNMEEGLHDLYCSPPQGGDLI